MRLRHNFRRSWVCSGTSKDNTGKLQPVKKFPAQIILLDRKKFDHIALKPLNVLPIPKITSISMYEWSRSFAVIGRVCLTQSLTLTAAKRYVTEAQV